MPFDLIVVLFAAFVMFPVYGLTEWIAMHHLIDNGLYFFDSFVAFAKNFVERQFYIAIGGNDLYNKANTRAMRRIRMGCAFFLLREEITLWYNRLLPY